MLQGKSFMVPTHTQAEEQPHTGNTFSSWAQQHLPTLCLDVAFLEGSEHVVSSFNPNSWQNEAFQKYFEGINQ